jgi:hypothetical protein
VVLGRATKSTRSSTGIFTPIAIPLQPITPKFALQSRMRLYPHASGPLPSNHGFGAIDRITLQELGLAQLAIVWHAPAEEHLRFQGSTRILNGERNV